MSKAIELFAVKFDPDAECYQPQETKLLDIIGIAFDCQCDGSLRFYNETLGDWGINAYVEAAIESESLQQEAIRNYEELHNCEIYHSYAKTLMAASTLNRERTDHLKELELMKRRF